MHNKIEDHKQILRALSLEDFLSFGLNQIAYIKPVHVIDKMAYALHAANGKPLAVIQSLEEAIITARQNDMEPVIVH